MYYLVRDYYDETKHKIFSDKDDIEEWVDELDEKKRTMLLVYSWEDGMHSDCRDGRRIYFDQYFIIMKSENVLDFIKERDLIRYDDNFLGANILEEVYKVDSRLVIRDYYEVKSLNVIEIYKPDKHGNYIRVWKKENCHD